MTAAYDALGWRDHTPRDALEQAEDVRQVADVVEVCSHVTIIHAVTRGKESGGLGR